MTPTTIDRGLIYQATSAGGATRDDVRAAWRTVYRAASSATASATSR